MLTTLSHDAGHPEPRARGSGTSGRCRSAATRCASSPGIVAAIWIGERRWVARGGRPGEVSDLAVWAVPFGLVGGRLYHVITDYQLYFGEGRSARSRRSTSGGRARHLGRDRAGRRRRRSSARGSRGSGCLPVLDAMAPGRPGRPGDRPLGQLVQPGALRQADRPAVGPGDRPGAPARRATSTDATFHPTFLYEFLWSLAGVRRSLIWADRRFRLGHGRVVALYVMVYTARPRLDRDAAHRRRSSSTTCSACGSTCGPRSCCSWPPAVYFVVSARRHPGREDDVYVRPPATRADHADDTSDEGATGESAT